MNLEGVDYKSSVSEKDIFDMKPGDKFLYRAKTSNVKFKKYLENRYFRDGGKIVLIRVDAETLLVSL